MVKKVLIVILSLLTLATIGLFIYEIVFGAGINSNNIIKYICAVVALAASFSRLIGSMDKGFNKRNKKDRMIIEESYNSEIKNAFIRKDQAKERKELINALILFNNKKYPETLKKLNLLLKKCRTNDDHAAVYTFIAVTYSRIGIHEKAIEFYSKVLKYDDTRSNVWSNIGFQYSAMGNHKEAVNVLTKAIQKDANNVNAYHNLSYAYMCLQDYVNAIVSADKALAIKSDITDVISILALCYCAIGDKESADKYYKMYVINGGSGPELRAMIDDMTYNNLIDHDIK